MRAPAGFGKTAGVSGGAEFGDEFFGVDGFGEELEGVAFGLGFTHELAGGGLSGEEEDAGGGKFLADFDAELDSGHFGHEDVAENDVGLDLAGGYERAIPT